MKKILILICLLPIAWCCGNSKKVLKKMISGGVNVCRINFSHTNHEEARNIISTVKTINQELKQPKQEKKSVWFKLQEAVPDREEQFEFVSLLVRASLICRNTSINN